MHRTGFTIALLVALATNAPAHAETRHLNVDHREIIRLVYQLSSESAVCGGTNDGPFKQVFPGGGIAMNEYSVPAGKELVITDILWRARSAPATIWIENRTIAVALSSYSQAGVFNGPIIQLPLILTPPSDFAADSVHLVAGVRLASRRIICTGAAQNSASSGAVSTIINMELLGYEVDKSQ